MCDILGLRGIAAAGTFKLTLTFTEEYPNKAPVVKFKSHMFHPNSECLLQPGFTACLSNFSANRLCAVSAALLLRH